MMDDPTDEDRRANAMLAAWTLAAQHLQANGFALDEIPEALASVALVKLVANTSKARAAKMLSIMARLYQAEQSLQ